MSVCSVKLSRAKDNGNSDDDACAGVAAQVHDVLSEMVYDVETHAHECEVAQLKRELAHATSALRVHEERERELILERQQVRTSTHTVYHSLSCTCAHSSV